MSFDEHLTKQGRQDSICLPSKKASPGDCVIDRVRTYTVPWTGLQATTRAYARIIDEVTSFR